MIFAVAPRLDEKIAAEGHGACIVQGCDGQRFTFDRFSLADFRGQAGAVTRLASRRG